MYSTCLFCNSDLGKNEAIEHFPVGRRLAFDAARGRLWVVCRRCERWNLTPLEERWEAIEECERAFTETRLRVSTDQIGLARLREGLELVRIGEPQRPELAAWRYGDQFGRRKRRQYYWIAGAAAVGGAAIVAGPVLGLVSVAALSPMMNLANVSRSLYQLHKTIAIPGPLGTTQHLALRSLPKAKLALQDGDVVLRLKTQRATKRPFWQFDDGTEELAFRGEDAVRAMGAILPAVNSGGGSEKQVRAAVDQIEETPDPAVLLHRAAETFSRRSGSIGPFLKSGRGLGVLPAADRLALEMLSHEESERRALEGELHVLEAAWREADEIAGIADTMFLPDDISARLERLKNSRDE